MSEIHAGYVVACRQNRITVDSFPSKVVYYGEVTELKHPEYGRVCSVGVSSSPLVLVDRSSVKKTLTELTRQELVSIGEELRVYYVKYEKIRLGRQTLRVYLETLREVQF